MPASYFANPLGRFGVCGSGCCGPSLPTSCEDTSRPICYVDKYATGAGDGTSWTDAYTTISAAIAERRTTHRIYIKGYGKSDTYTETLSFGDSATLVGVSDAWVTGSITGGSSCCYYRINTTGSSGSFTTGGHNSKYVLCTVDSSYLHGFSAGVATNILSFCVAEGTSVGIIGGTCLDCSVANVLSVGFQASQCYRCFAYDIHSTNNDLVGFYGCYVEDCVASNISTSGYNKSVHGFDRPTGGLRCTAEYLTGYLHAFGFYRLNSITGTVTLEDCVSRHIQNTLTSSTTTSVRGFHGSGLVLIGCTASYITAPYTGQADGFYAYSATDCVADNINGAEYSSGFFLVTIKTNCSCTNPQPANGCFAP